jgi:hypothetical protein
MDIPLSEVQPWGTVWDIWPPRCSHSPKWLLVAADRDPRSQRTLELHYLSVVVIDEECIMRIQLSILPLWRVLPFCEEPFRWWIAALSVLRGIPSIPPECFSKCTPNDPLQGGHPALSAIESCLAQIWILGRIPGNGKWRRLLLFPHPVEALQFVSVRRCDKMVPLFSRYGIGKVS